MAPKMRISLVKQLSKWYQLSAGKQHIFDEVKTQILIVGPSAELQAIPQGSAYVPRTEIPQYVI